jgi:hypothetical protein
VRLVRPARSALSARPDRRRGRLPCRRARPRPQCHHSIEPCRAAIHTAAFISGCAVPTAAAQVAETMAGMHRTAAASGQLPVRKRAATAEILRQILEPITPDLAGLRDRALLRRLEDRAGRGARLPARGRPA